MSPNALSEKIKESLEAAEKVKNEAVLEAMGKGLPVICSNTCGTRWYVQEGITGRLFEDGSLDSLVDSLEGFVDPEVVEKMGSAALNYAQSVLAPEVFYKAFIDILKDQNVAP